MVQMRFPTMKHPALRIEYWYFVLWLLIPAPPQVKSQMLDSLPHKEMQGSYTSSVCW